MPRLLVLIIGVCALAVLVGFIDTGGERAIMMRLNAGLYGAPPSGIDDSATRAFYQQRVHRLAWWQDGRWRPETGVAIAWLAAVSEPGADGRDSGISALGMLFDNQSAATLSPDAIALRETILTQTLLTIAHDRRSGRVAPRQASWMAATAPDPDLPGTLSHALETGTLSAWLAGLVPASDSYRLLLAALPGIEALQTLPWPVIEPEDIVAPGEHDPRLPAVRRRLRDLGALTSSVVGDHGTRYDDATVRAVMGLQTAAGMAATGTIDTATLTLMNTVLLEDLPFWADRTAIPVGNGILMDGQDPRLAIVRARLILLGDLADQEGSADAALLSRAVAGFQSRHGLEISGMLDLETIAELNTTPLERTATILANLERMRWLPATDDLEARHVIVNIPAFELVAFADGQPVLTMPVVVGKLHKQTPVISDAIVNLKFAPAWTVPFSIASREYLPKVQEDPAWIADHNFRIFTDWSARTEVDPYTVDWMSIEPETLPFVFRQNPSAWSALGLVRFSLTNPYNIYLHDTGYRNAFALVRRDISHGCIRVGDPLALTRFALESEPVSWSDEEIVRAMQADDTHFHDLASPLPVHMRYLTAWVDALGQLQFRRDIYGRDSQLLGLLDAADTERDAILAAQVSATSGP